MRHSLFRIPYIGVGIGLRNEIAEKTLQHGNEIDVLEIIAEKFFSDKPTPLHFLERFSERFPIIPHGIKLSIGSAEPYDEKFLRQMRGLVEHVQAPYYSDHFTLAHEGWEYDTGHLSPLWYTKEMLEHVIERVHRVQDYIGVPLVLENITAPFVLPGADFAEAEFIAKVHERTGCGLLLDVTNVHINAYNRGEDALALLKEYPMEAVIQVHLAGGAISHGYFYDTHSEELVGPNEGVWELFQWVVQHSSVRTVIIERDDNFKPNFETMILTDLRRARSYMEEGRASREGRSVGKAANVL